MKYRIKSPLLWLPTTNGGYSLKEGAIIEIQDLSQPGAPCFLMYHGDDERGEEILSEVFPRRRNGEWERLDT